MFSSINNIISIEISIGLSKYIICIHEECKRKHQDLLPFLKRFVLLAIYTR